MEDSVFVLSLVNATRPSSGGPWRLTSEALVARKKKPASKSIIRELQDKIEAQRRRALRPALPINAHSRVSESRVEREHKLERKRRQRRDWETD